MLAAILASRPPASSFRVVRYASLSNVAFLCSHYGRLDRPQDWDYTYSAVEISSGSPGFRPQVCEIQQLALVAVATDSRRRAWEQWSTRLLAGVERVMPAWANGLGFR